MAELVALDTFEYPDYDGPRRRRLLNKCLYKAENLVDEVGTPREMQQITTAISMLIDRKRLEDGEVTSREEVVNVIELREKLLARIEAISERDRMAEQVSVKAEARSFDAKPNPRH